MSEERPYYHTNEDQMSRIEKCRKLAATTVNNSEYAAGKNLPIVMPGDLFVVWYCKTLGVYKALLSAPIEGFPYVEVTYDFNHNRTYVDVYSKVLNKIFPDSETPAFIRK